MMIRLYKTNFTSADHSWMTRSPYLKREGSIVKLYGYFATFKSKSHFKIKFFHVDSIQNLSFYGAKKKPIVIFAAEVRCWQGVKFSPEVRPKFVCCHFIQRAATINYLRFKFSIYKRTHQNISYCSCHNATSSHTVAHSSWSGFRAGLWISYKHQYVTIVSVHIIRGVYSSNEI